MRIRALFFLLAVTLILNFDVCFAQTNTPKHSNTGKTDLLEIMVKAFHISVKPKPPGKKRVSYSIMPVSGTNSSGNKILVSSISAAFILGSEDSTNVSSVYVLPYTDFYENIGVGTKVNLWTPSNKWNIPAEFRVSSLVQYTYGLGSSTNKSDEFKLNYDNVRLYFSGNRKLVEHLYMGAGINYDRYYNVSQQSAPTSPSAFEKYGIGTGETSFSTGLTFNVLVDTRKNSINPDNGNYFSFVYRANPPFLTNDNSWSSVYLDYRRYLSLDPHKRKILTFWSYYWGTLGEVPYFNLPGTQLEFGTRSGRGYGQGRFRGKQMLYFETEYRFDITNNGLLGAVLFCNVQSLTESTTNRFQYVNPAGGFGARIKFNKESSTNLTLDFAIGKQSFNFYIGLGEFF